MSDITDPTCPASAGEAAQEQAAPAAELSTPGASLENFSVAEPENALPRATLETLPETIAAACGRAGWTSLMGSIWLIGGIQLLGLGVVGEYIGKIYNETKRRPRFIIESVLNKA